MSVEPARAFSTALVNGLVANGVSHACVSPGSRNTPILLALSAHPDVEITVHHDERSAAFFALGLAKATGQPAVLSCTSGTAATEYLPALTEARMAHTPLIAMTADRPPELQDRGSPQTIDQTNLYGVAAKWFHDTGVPTAESVGHAATVGKQAVTISLEPPAGPVHLNLPLREPLVPDTRLPREDHAPVASRPESSRRGAATEAEVAALADRLSGNRVAIVAGRTTRGDAGSATMDLAKALGAVVVADPQAESRFLGGNQPMLMSAADLLLEAGFGATAPPDIVLHIGAVHTSKAVNRWLGNLDTDVIHLHDGRWHDPLRIASQVLAADPTTTMEALTKIVSPGPQEFAAAWREADDAAMAAMRSLPSSWSEPAIAMAVMDAVPAGSVVFAGSSMPVRLVDSFGLRRDHPCRLFANRGANGIDGSIATSLGLAAAGIGPTLALIGDLSALVDIGSLATAARLQIPVTIVVINNDGGGIFEYLPHADPGRIAPDDYTKMIVAPHGQRLASIADSFGIDVATLSSLDELGAAAAETPDRPRLIELVTERTAGPQDRRHAVAAVSAAIS